MRYVTSRRQALQEGSWQGRYGAMKGYSGRPELEAGRCAAGGGPDARAIPKRWREVFKRAFVRAMRRQMR